MEQVCTRVVDKMLNHSLDVAMMTWRDHARKQQRATTAHVKQMRRGENIVARVLLHWTQV